MEIGLASASFHWFFFLSFFFEYLKLILIVASKEWTHVPLSLSPLSPTSPSQIPALCEHSAVTLLDGSILAFGGNNGSHRLSCVYLFRPRPSERGDAILDGCIVSIIDNDFSHHVCPSSSSSSCRCHWNCFI